MTIPPFALYKYCCCFYCLEGKIAETCVLDLWLVRFSASYSTLAQFMMNYGNEWDMDLILSYVGTQIWGTAENHVLLLTSRKSCLVTSRGKLVHRPNTGWDMESARLHTLVAGTNSEKGIGCFELSWCAIIWLYGCIARLRLFPRRGLHTGSFGG